jgi:hypothetical protein
MLETPPFPFLDSDTGGSGLDWPFLFCHTLAMTTTVTNPILYGWLNTNLKHLFRAMIPYIRERDRERDRGAAATSAAGGCGGGGGPTATEARGDNGGGGVAGGGGNGRGRSKRQGKTTAPAAKLQENDSPGSKCRVNMQILSIYTYIHICRDIPKIHICFIAG